MLPVQPLAAGALEGSSERPTDTQTRFSKKCCLQNPPNFARSSATTGTPRTTLFCSGRRRLEGLKHEFFCEPPVQLAHWSGPGGGGLGHKASGSATSSRVRHARGQISGNEAQGKENRPPRLQNGWGYPLGTPALDHNRTTALGRRYIGDAVSETIMPQISLARQSVSLLRRHSGQETIPSRR